MPPSTLHLQQIPLSETSSGIIAKRSNSNLPCGNHANWRGGRPALLLAKAVLLLVRRMTFDTFLINSPRNNRPQLLLLE